MDRTARLWGRLGASSKENLMRKLYLITISGALALTWTVSTASAFTLEEMNCFSSDIHALEPADTYLPTSRATFDTHLAESRGTNGIPCDPRDPKAPPKKKKK